MEIVLITENEVYIIKKYKILYIFITFSKIRLYRKWKYHDMNRITMRFLCPLVKTDNVNDSINNSVL